MSASEISAGKAFVEVAVKDVAEKGLNIVAAKLQGFSKTVGAIGTKMAAAAQAIPTELLALVPGYATAVDAMDKFTDATGMSAEQVQGLGAKLGGLALASPVGLATTAVLGGIAVWALYTESGQAAVTAVTDAFGPMVDTVTESVTGIKNAIAAGDWELAGQIAGTGVKVAFLQALDGIAKLLPASFGPMGETLKNLGSDALQGNWEAVMEDLSSLWSSWCEGVITSFAGAVDAIMGLWSGMVEKISGWLLEASASDGVMGAVATMALGVDMKTETGKSKMLEDRKLAADSIPQIEQNLATAKASGDTEKVTANERFLKEQKSKAAGTFDYKSGDAMAGAKDSISKQVGDWKTAAGDWTSKIREQAKQQGEARREEAEQGAAALRERDGTSSFDDLLADEAEKLKDLNAKAAEEATAAAEEATAAAEDAATPADEGAHGGRTIGTFSAYSLGQQFGAGAGTDEKILDTEKESVEATKEQTVVIQNAYDFLKGVLKGGPAELPNLSWGASNTD